MTSRKHIVIGAGPLGVAVANCLAAKGQSVSLINRSGKDVGKWKTTACDVSDPVALGALLNGPSTLYICSAPAYHRWSQEFPALINGIVQAAAGRDLHIVLADNLYAYGRSTQPFTESQAAAPCSRKGEVRHKVAQQLMALNGQGAVRVTMMRAATFFGPDVEQSSVGKTVFASALAGKGTYVIGKPELAHAFTYVPDFAAALVQIADNDAAFGHCWHAPSHNLPSFTSFLQRIADHGKKPLQIKIAGPFMMRIIGLFTPAMRELIEMLYLFDAPWSISWQHTQQCFNLPLTPLDKAISQTVASIQP